MGVLKRTPKEMLNINEEQRKKGKAETEECTFLAIQRSYFKELYSFKYQLPIYVTLTNLNKLRPDNYCLGRLLCNQCTK